jgi:uncharacterized protein YciI
MKRLLFALLLLGLSGSAAPGASLAAEARPAYDGALARRLGADERGMRSYVLVILKSGPHHVPEGKARDAMFAGHFANIARLAAAGKLVLAGPFDDDPAHWRGLFLLAVDNLDEARRLTATDPVIKQGEMVAEYHAWYGSAAAMMLPELHARLVPPKP